MFYLTFIKTTRIVMTAHGNLKVSYLGQVFAHKKVVSKYYYDSPDKNFSRIFKFIKPVTVWFPGTAYIYKKKGQ